MTTAIEETTVEKTGNLIIKPGGHYKTRDGGLARVYAIDSNPASDPIHGAIAIGENYWIAVTWGKDGYRFANKGESDSDLVEQWIGPPVVRWKSIPEYIIAVAMNNCEEWYGYLTIPEKRYANDYEGDAWRVALKDQEFSKCVHIPNEFTPIYGGNWQDSMVIRPGYEED